MSLPSKILSPSKTCRAGASSHEQAALLLSSVPPLALKVGVEYVETDHDPAAMGGTYEFAKLASANLREKDDSWNTAIGGFLAGSIMGIRCSPIAQCPSSP